MAFWGVEVKPGKRVLSSSNGKRLRITQASLGIGNVTERTIVQCSVGTKKRPIILCVLVPYVAESRRLELEFDEIHDLIFSVIGPQSIHLTGYFVNDNRPSFLDSDIEPHGISIEDTEGDSYHSEDDEYEDSFIDDSELPVPSSISSHQGKKKTKELGSKRLRKKLDVEFNQSDELNESKDEDTGNQGCELTENKDVTEASLCQQERYKIGDEKEIPQQMEPQEVGDDDAKDRELENGESKDTMLFRVSMEPQEVGVDDAKDRELENGESMDTMVFPDTVKSSDIVGEDGAHTTQITSDHIQPNDSANVLVLSENDPAPEEMMVIADSVKNKIVIGEDGTHLSQNMSDHIQTNDSKNVEDHLDHVPGVVSYENVSESKVNDIVTLMGSSLEDEAANLNNAIEVVTIKQGLDISNKKDIPTHHDEAMINADTNTVPDSLPVDTPSKKRTLEKKKTCERKKCKSEVEGSFGTNTCNAIQNEGKVVVNEPNEEKTVVYKQDDVTEKQCESHSLSDGLIIEELTKRDPNGKLALRGRKVKIHFTGMLKETGAVFYTSVGKNPCKFRLGDEEIIDGFNMGIDGMRLGDKRETYNPTISRFWRTRIWYECTSKLMAGV
ncbi:Peptidyl-prolyl cis-trans isomerase FKBP43 [Sesamum angolense]|uniref:peptidylprolyl isomerase n=1 Tax=Sesamum angolense TaxID=2727404 RepID=A0AAE1T836_9LAMI|nr:Peptidyl-prolyl cis-trans isomerase FKBP43 [Sesamum angolense]